MEQLSTGTLTLEDIMVEIVEFDDLRLPKQTEMYNTYCPFDQSVRGNQAPKPVYELWCRDLDGKQYMVMETFYKQHAIDRMLSLAHSTTSCRIHTRIHEPRWDEWSPFS